MAKSPNLTPLFAELTELFGNFNRLLVRTDAGDDLTGPEDGACKPGWNGSAAVNAVFPITGTLSIPFGCTTDYSLSRVNPDGSQTTISTGNTSSSITITPAQHGVTSGTSPCVNFLVFFWAVCGGGSSRTIICVRTIQVCGTCTATSDTDSDERKRRPRKPKRR